MSLKNYLSKISPNLFIFIIIFEYGTPFVYERERFSRSRIALEFQDNTESSAPSSSSSLQLPSAVSTPGKPTEHSGNVLLKQFKDLDVISWLQLHSVKYGNASNFDMKVVLSSLRHVIQLESIRFPRIKVYNYDFGDGGIKELLIFNDPDEEKQWIVNIEEVDMRQNLLVFPLGDLGFGFAKENTLVVLRKSKSRKDPFHYIHIAYVRTKSRRGKSVRDVHIEWDNIKPSNINPIPIQFKEFQPDTNVNCSPRKCSLVEQIFGTCHIVKLPCSVLQNLPISKLELERMDSLIREKQPFIYELAKTLTINKSYLEGAGSKAESYSYKAKRGKSLHSHHDSYVHMGSDEEAHHLGENKQQYQEAPEGSSLKLKKRDVDQDPANDPYTNINNIEQQEPNSTPYNVNSEQQALKTLNSDQEPGTIPYNSNTNQNPRVFDTIDTDQDKSDAPNNYVNNTQQPEPNITTDNIDPEQNRVTLSTIITDQEPADTPNNFINNKQQPEPSTTPDNVKSEPNHGALRTIISDQEPADTTTNYNNIQQQNTTPYSNVKTKLHRGSLKTLSSNQEGNLDTPHDTTQNDIQVQEPEPDTTPYNANIVTNQDQGMDMSSTTTEHSQRQQVLNNRGNEQDGKALNNNASCHQQQPQQGILNKGRSFDTDGQIERAVPMVDVDRGETETVRQEGSDSVKRSLDKNHDKKTTSPSTSKPIGLTAVKSGNGQIGQPVHKDSSELVLPNNGNNGNQIPSSFDLLLLKNASAQSPHTPPHPSPVPEITHPLPQIKALPKALPSSDDAAEANQGNSYFAIILEKIKNSPPGKYTVRPLECLSCEKFGTFLNDYDETILNTYVANNIIANIFKNDSLRKNLFSPDPHETLQKHSTIPFLGYGNCYSSPDLLSKAPVSMEIDDLIEFYAESLGENCHRRKGCEAHQTKHKLREIITSKYHLLEIWPDMSIRYNKSSILPKDLILSSREFREFMIALIFSAYTTEYRMHVVHYADKHYNNPNLVNQHQSERMKFLTRLVLRVVDDLVKQFPQHIIKGLRYLLQILQDKYLALVAEYISISEYTFKQDERGPSVYKAINRNDRIQVIALRDFIINGVAAITRTGAGSFPAFISFFNRNFKRVLHSFVEYGIEKVPEIQGGHNQPRSIAEKELDLIFKRLSEASHIEDEAGIEEEIKNEQEEGERKPKVNKKRLVKITKY